MTWMYVNQTWASCSKSTPYPITVVITCQYGYEFPYGTSKVIGRMLMSTKGSPPKHSAPKEPQDPKQAQGKPKKQLQVLPPGAARPALSGRLLLQAAVAGSSSGAPLLLLAQAGISTTRKSPPRGGFGSESHLFGRVCLWGVTLDRFGLHFLVALLIIYLGSGLVEVWLSFMCLFGFRVVVFVLSLFFVVFVIVGLEHLCCFCGAWVSVLVPGFDGGRGWNQSLVGYFKANVRLDRR